MCVAVVLGRIVLLLAVLLVMAAPTSADAGDRCAGDLLLVDGDQQVALVEATAGMELHSVVWAPPLPDCA